MNATYEQQLLDRTTAHAKRLSRDPNLARRLFRATYSAFRLDVRTTNAAHAVRTIARRLPRPGFRVVTEERAAQAALAAWRWQTDRTTSGFAELSDAQQTMHMATRDQHRRHQHSKSQRRIDDTYRWEADHWLRYEETDPFPQR